MNATRLLLIAVLLLPLPVSAQTILGMVRDEAGGAVAGAEVVLVAASGVERLRVVSDSAGMFSMRDVGAGEYRLHVSCCGFRSVDSEPIRLGIGETVTVEVQLAKTVIPLAPITVTARSADPRHTAFHVRRLTGGQGRFITRADIERTPHARTTDLLRQVSGVTIVSSYQPGRSAVRGNIISIRGGGGRICEPAMYIDGVRVAQHVQSSMDDVLQAGSIEGIEVYTLAAAAPAGYGGQGDTCGVIMFWTRVSRDPDPGSRRWTQVALGVGILGALFLIAR
jgi:hypothetical protein